MSGCHVWWGKGGARQPNRPPFRRLRLHTNASENDIRYQVTKRQVSDGTKADTGRDCRDAFLGLGKTFPTTNGHHEKYRMSSFLIHTSSPRGGRTFILACDESGLRWLLESFRGVAKRLKFMIGDGHPVASDGKCFIEVSAIPIAAATAITCTGAGNFRWSMPAKQADDYADLIEGMIDFPDACHQYLEAAQPDVPVVVVSKGEYDTEVLRKMRDA